LLRICKLRQEFGKCIYLTYSSRRLSRCYSIVAAILSRDIRSRTVTRQTNSSNDVRVGYHIVI